MASMIPIRHKPEQRDGFAPDSLHLKRVSITVRSNFTEGEQQNRFAGAKRCTGAGGEEQFVTPVESGAGDRDGTTIAESPASQSLIIASV